MVRAGKSCLQNYSNHPYLCALSNNLQAPLRDAYALVATLEPGPRRVVRWRLRFELGLGPLVPRLKDGNFPNFGQ